MVEYLAELLQVTTVGTQLRVHIVQDGMVACDYLKEVHKIPKRCAHISSTQKRGRWRKK